MIFEGRLCVRKETMLSPQKLQHESGAMAKVTSIGQRTRCEVLQTLGKGRFYGSGTRARVGPETRSICLTGKVANRQEIEFRFRGVENSMAVGNQQGLTLTDECLRRRDSDSVHSLLSITALFPKLG